MPRVCIGPHPPSVGLIAFMGTQLNGSLFPQNAWERLASLPSDQSPRIAKRIRDDNSNKRLALHLNTIDEHEYAPAPSSFLISQARMAG